MDAELQLTLFGRVALAAALGFAIGLEREFRGKSAGDRTFALLAAAAAGVTGAGAELLGSDGTGRVIQGVLTGVGFIGAGLIFRRAPGDVRGLTTAASSWAVTAIAILVGLGSYLLAVLAAALILVILEFDSIPALRRIREAAESAATPPPDDEA